MKCFDSLFAAVTAGAALLVLAGCSSTHIATTPIEVRDQRSFVPNLKASFNFGKGVDTPSRPQDGHSIEVEVTGARGSDSQALGAADSPVIVGGQTFTPPQQLRHDFRFQYSDIGWRWRKFFGGGAVGLEALAGLGYAEVRLNTSSDAAPLRASESFNTRGVQGGIGLVWRSEAGTSVQIRAIEFLPLRSGLTGVSRGEIYLNQALSSHITARIGYTGWQVDRETNTNSSDIRLRFSGPSLGLLFDLGP
jgi:hypothetical protein